MGRVWLLVVLLAGCGDSAATPMDVPGGDDRNCEAEACNGADDDCDGRADEDFDFDSDLRNCGGCDITCTEDPGTTGYPTCVLGSCTVAVCEDGSRNCDLDPENMCESDLADVTNCGECGVGCELYEAVVSCGTSVCELLSCSFGYDNCDGRTENGCEVEVATDDRHCGGCGRACPSDLANAATICVDGICGLRCDPGFEDCDGSLINGCEQDLSSPLSCGSCGVRCGGELCSGDSRVGWSCTPPPCLDPPTQCGESCVDVDTNPLHCGGCRGVCPAARNARPTCDVGVCRVACDLGYDDCDGLDANGCETRLDDPANCGACGRSCELPGTLTICVDECTVVGCVAPNRDCNGEAGDGCEASVDTDASNCGACGVACPGATPRCAGGVCVAPVDGGLDGGVDGGAADVLSDSPTLDADSEFVAFVSSRTYSANLGGLAGADLECESMAATAGLAGRYRAILSSSSVAARDRIAISGAVMDTSGTVLATDASELWSGAIRATLSRNELGVNVGTSIVWTGTEADGTSDRSGGFCGEWRTTSGGAEAGRTDRSDSGWISIYGSGSSGHACSNISRIYCIRSDI